MGNVTGPMGQRAPPSSPSAAVGYKITFGTVTVTVESLIAEGVAHHGLLIDCKQIIQVDLPSSTWCPVGEGVM